MAILLPWFPDGDPTAPVFVQPYHRLLGDYYQTYDIGLFYAPQYVSAWQAIRFIPPEVTDYKSLISAAGYQQILIDRFIPFKTPLGYDWLEKLELWILANYSYIGAEITEADITEIQLPNFYTVDPFSWVYYLTADNGDFNWVREKVEFTTWQPKYDILHNSVIFFRPIIIELDEDGNPIEDEDDEEPEEVIIEGYEQYIPEEISPELINILHWESWCLRDMSSFPAERTFQKITSITIREVVDRVFGTETYFIFNNETGEFEPFTRDLFGYVISSRTEEINSIDSEPGANSFSIHYVERATVDPWGFRTVREPITLGYAPSGYSFNDIFNPTDIFFANESVNLTSGEYGIKQTVESPQTGFLNVFRSQAEDSRLPPYLIPTDPLELQENVGVEVIMLLANYFGLNASGELLQATPSFTRELFLIEPLDGFSGLPYVNINGRFPEQADSFYLRILNPITEATLFPNYDPEDTYPQLRFNMPDSIRTKEIHQALDAGYWGNGQAKETPVLGEGNYAEQFMLREGYGDFDAEAVIQTNGSLASQIGTTLQFYASQIGLHNLPVERVPTYQFFDSGSNREAEPEILLSLMDLIVKQDFETQAKLGLWPVETYNYSKLNSFGEAESHLYLGISDILGDMFALDTRASILQERGFLEVFQIDNNVIEVAKAIGSPFAEKEVAWDFGTSLQLEFSGGAGLAEGIALLSEQISDLGIDRFRPESFQSLVDEKLEQLAD